MDRTTARLAAWSLVVGSAVATVGYVLGFVVAGGGAGRFAASSWPTLYTIALVGDVLVVLGLPTLFVAQQGRAPWLTRIGYVGLFVPLVVLNVGEGVFEGFVKPYLAHHGGVPAQDPRGLDAFELPALLVLVVGVVCLGVAVLRAGVLPRVVGVLFIVCPFLAVAGLPGAAALVSDYLCFAALAVVGVSVLRSTGRAVATETLVGAAPAS
jgi:hypothetical protein